MNQTSVFQIIGPVMIGPSSSHTAGAVRIGRMARTLLDEEPIKVEILLYGSFARTYRGHGTDRALVAGLMGMAPDDPRIRDALSIAGEAGLKVDFQTSDKGEVHPNTAFIKLKGVSGKEIMVEGSSVGGGNITITRVDQYQVDLTGRYPALLVEHLDRPGVTGIVTTVLGGNGINIAEMRMARKQRGGSQLMIIETDQSIPDPVLKAINTLPNVIRAIRIEPIQE